PTTVKSRIIAHDQQVVRADGGRADDVDAELEYELAGSVRSSLSSCQALVVSDYQKGVVTAGLMKTVLPLARRRGIPVLVDPKVAHFPLYRGVTVVTPNQLEAEQATGIRIRGDADLAAAGARILKRLGCQAALVTRGEHGMSLFERDRRPPPVPTAPPQVRDR